jgi:hypothetical protein
MNRKNSIKGNLNKNQQNDKRTACTSLGVSPGLGAGMGAGLGASVGGIGSGSVEIGGDSKINLIKNKINTSLSSNNTHTKISNNKSQSNKLINKNSSASFLKSNPNNLIKEDLSTLALISYSQITIENLNSYNNQLELIHLQLENCFKSQSKIAEKEILDRIDESIKLREVIFNLTSKLNAMINLSKIEEYLNFTYSKILNIQPKLNEVLENIEDFKSNINYGLDRIHLEDNIVCDEKSLEKNLELVTSSMEKLNNYTEDKFIQVEELKMNLNIFLNLINEEKIELNKFKNFVADYKTNILDENTNKISQHLIEQNKQMEAELFKI